MLSHFLYVIALAHLMTSVLASDPQESLPPVLPWHGRSESLISKPDDPWITPAERTGLTDTPNYEETIEYIRKLVAAAPGLLSLQEFGRSSQGRALYVVIASKSAPFTPERFRDEAKPTLLVQAGIHSGEIDGKDAGLMLLRDIVVRGKDSLLDHVNLLFVPIFNVDGHERSSEWNRPNQRGPVHMGWRTTAQNLNLNRDYMKADSPEMQAMLGLIATWSPSLYIDVHVTDGIDYQYDITFGFNGEPGVPAWSPHIGKWLNDVFRADVETALKSAGHIPGVLVFERDDRDLTKGFDLFAAMPRFSTGYGDVRHLPTILVENHSLKPYRQRVVGTYVLLEAALQVLGGKAESLQQAITADRNTRPVVVPMNWTAGGGVSHRDFLGVAYENYDSPASGTNEVRWLGTPKVYPNSPVYFCKASRQLSVPKAYIVPASKPEVIRRLKLHGIEMETLKTAETLQVKMCRLVDPHISPGEGSHPYEARHTVETEVKHEMRTETFPPGSVLVSTDQPLGVLAVALLDPQAGDSLSAWGFFPEILQRTEYIEGYVIAPFAERMLREDPKLKEAFQAKVSADPKFAADRYARLQWFYQRSKFYDDRYLLYPVGFVE